MERLSSTKKRWGILLAIVFVVCLLGFWGIRSWPAIGSKMANPMRRLLGAERVAHLETILFTVQDRFNKWKYDQGLAEPQVPWNAAQQPQEAPALATPVSMSETPTPNLAAPTATPLLEEAPPGRPSATPTLPPSRKTAVPTPTSTAWRLPDVAAFGALDGEGVWQPYIQNMDGQVVAYRTFLQPDPERPYALAAVVAFDLTQTELHFVLGTVEPGKPGGPHGTGIIPPEDKQPGKLLAAFNGGFIAEHGQFGAMANGVVPLPAKPGLATLAIYPDGEVRIGEWGKDLSETAKYSAWRQNAIPIIHQGEINPKVYTGTWEDWGANYDYNAVTLRSSVGLSEDSRVLYYFAGPSLLMPPLAHAMAATGVYNGMLLDINPTHAHFTAIRVVEGKLTAEPLFPEEMNVWVDRYIRAWGYEQDFFYITAKE